MERGNTKHGPHLDEEMAREIREHTIEGSRVRDWQEPEPAGEDQPGVRLLPYGEVTAPAAPSPAEIDERSELGRWIPRSALPGDRDALVRAAERSGAPDAILEQVRALPAGETFETVVQVWGALGHRNEARSGVS
jgi:hypothetical protein